MALPQVLTADGARPKKRSVSWYASGVFSESTIGMVASIVHTHSPARRVFKSLLLTLCVAGFLYQSITYLLHVFEYPTTVGIDIQRPEEYMVPAYTFCSNNGMKRSVFCSMYPERCYEPSKKFCSKWYSYCGTNKTLIPKKEYYVLEDTMSFEDILKYGDDLSEFLVLEKSVIGGNVSGPYLRTKQQESGAMICYSLHSVIENRKIPKRQTRSEFSFTHAISDRLTFYLEEDEMFVPGNRPGLLFSVHSPFEAVNPFKKGIFMKPGRSYRIYVSMEEEVLLQEPYQPTCINYEEMWAANNRTGPRNQEMCHHKCFLGVSILCVNCSLSQVLYPNNERKCTPDDLKEIHCTEKDIANFYQCTSQCREDCKYTKYSAEVFERYETKHAQNETEELEASRLVTVEVYLEDAEIVTLRHSPKYISVEVFSAIGGFIGVWLGISFMDIIDVFASAFLVCRYTIRKYQKQ